MTWLRRWSTPDGSRMRLLCFPGGGGAAHLYRSWGARMPPCIEVMAVELPGHGTRFDEPLMTDFNALVGALADEVERLLDRPLVIFGHSIGALMGLETARAVKRRRAWRPEALLAAACASPDRAVVAARPYEISDENLVTLLREWGGTDTAVMSEPDYLQSVLSVLRADLELAAGRPPAGQQPPLDCPIRAYVGESDPSVDRVAAAGWAGESNGDFEVHGFPGGHFFMREAQTELLNRIYTDIAALTSLSVRNR